jgi:hypothetical protein
LLRQIIGARVARLGEDAGLLLTMAAVIGQAVPLDLWAAVGEPSDDALAAVVGPAVAARVLTETPDGQGMRFAHALVREALYEAIPLPRRRALHRRVAEALLATPAPDPDAVAHHLRQAGDPRATDWLLRAGDRARHAYAWLTAAERYESARQILERQGTDQARRGWLLCRLAGLYRYDDTPRALAYLEEGEALGVASGDQALVANARFDHGLFLCFVGDFQRGLSDLEVGLAWFEARSPEEHAHAGAMMEYTPGMERGTLALWLALAGQYDRARQMAEGMVSHALDPLTIWGVGESAFGDTLFGLFCAYAALGRPADARLAYTRARDAYRSTYHYTLIGATALWALCTVELPYRADNPAAIRRLVNEAEEAWQRISGGVLDTFPASIARLPLLVLEGRWAEAHALGPRRFGHWFIDWFALPYLARLACAQGDDAAAWRLIDTWLPDGPHTAPGGSIFFTGEALATQAATLALDAGNLERACAWLELHDRWLDWSDAVLGWADGHLGWAVYHRAKGDLAAARERASQALAHASEPRQPLALLAAYRMLFVFESCIVLLL